MADIAMCKDDECPSKSNCYRFLAKPAEMLQTIGEFGRKPGESKCSYYWEAGSRSVVRRLNAQLKD